eukprot:9731553-Lingulodinium_polyedra.AAC.1
MSASTGKTQTRNVRPSCLIRALVLQRAMAGLRSAGSTGRMAAHHEPPRSPMTRPSLPPDA